MKMNSLDAMRKLGELTRILDRKDLMQPIYAASCVSTTPRQWKQFLRIPILHATRKRYAAALAMIAELETLELPVRPTGTEAIAFHFGLRGI
jgi:hypothetical protein